MNTDKQSPPTAEAYQTSVAGRQSAPDMLQSMINQKYNEAHRLKVIRNMLPSQMTEEQDAALWSVLCELRR